MKSNTLNPQTFTKTLRRQINKVDQYKHLETLTSSILTAQLLLHYLEELDRLGSNYNDRQLKNYLKLAKKRLVKWEETKFDKVFDKEENVTHHLSSKLQSGVENLVKKGFSDMLFRMEIEEVYAKYPKRIENFVNKLKKL